MIFGLLLYTCLIPQLDLASGDSIAESLTGIVKKAQTGKTTWDKAIIDCGRQFGPILLHADRKRMFELMSHFGDSDETALGILLGSGFYGAPWGGGYFGYDGSLDGRFRLTEYGHDGTNQAMLLIAEVQARYFVSHPQQASRYAHFVRWTGAFDRMKLDKILKVTEDGFVTGEYWYHCRNFLCMAASEDVAILDKLDSPQDCYPAFKSWIEGVTVKMAKSGSRKAAVARVESARLPTWKGPAPTPTQYRDLAFPHPWLEEEQKNGQRKKDVR